MKKIIFVYITTNLLNKKQYVGDHTTSNINDEYFGSGILIKKAIKKYGKESFSKLILEEFETKQEAFNAQEKYINEYNTLEPNGYNVSPKGGHQITGGCSNKTRKKISINTKKAMQNPEIKEKIKGPKSKEHIKHISESHKGLEPTNKGKKGLYKHTKEEKEKISINHRKYQLEETRNKISNALRGKKRKSHTIEHNKRISRGLEGKYDGKTLYQRWIEKFGIEEANIKEKNRCKKISDYYKNKFNKNDN